METDPEEAIVLPISAELDLHHFAPKEVGELVPAYLEAAREAGFFEVRIVHGKGKGILGKRVAAILARHPLVAGFRTAPMEAGSWGATLVTLHPPSRPSDV